MYPQLLKLIFPHFFPNDFLCLTPNKADFPSNIGWDSGAASVWKEFL